MNLGTGKVQNLLSKEAKERVFIANEVARVQESDDEVALTYPFKDLFDWNASLLDLNLVLGR